MASKSRNAKTFDDKSQTNQKPFPGQTKPDDNFRRQAADRGQEPMPNKNWSDRNARAQVWEGKSGNKGEGESDQDEFDHDDAEVDEHKNIPEQPPKF
jgi:hypothetical protein